MSPSGAYSFRSTTRLIRLAATRWVMIRYIAAPFGCHRRSGLPKMVTRIPGLMLGLRLRRRSHWWGCREEPHRPLSGC